MRCGARLNSESLFFQGGRGGRISCTLQCMFLVVAETLSRLNPTYACANLVEHFISSHALTSNFRTYIRVPGGGGNIARVFRATP